MKFIVRIKYRNSDCYQQIPDVTIAVNADDIDVAMRKLLSTYNKDLEIGDTIISTTAKDIILGYEYFPISEAEGEEETKIIDVRWVDLNCMAGWGEEKNALQQGSWYYGKYNGGGWPPR